MRQPAALSPHGCFIRFSPIDAPKHWLGLAPRAATVHRSEPRFACAADGARGFAAERTAPMPSRRQLLTGTALVAAPTTGLHRFALAQAAPVPPRATDAVR